MSAMTNGGTRVVMPRLGESIVEGTIIRWLVAPGERVTRGQILAEVETDKATSEIPAPSAGRVRELLASEGSTVPVGEAILALDPEHDAAPSSAPRADAGARHPGEPVTPAALDSAAAPGALPGPAVGPPPAGAVSGQPPDRLPPRHLAPRGIDGRGGPVRSSPAVRRLARRHGIDLGRLQGSGRGGRITRDDLLQAIAGAGGTPSGRSAAPGARVPADLGLHAPPGAPPVSGIPRPAARGELSPFPTMLPAPPLADDATERPQPAPAGGPARTRTYRIPAYQVQVGDRVVPFSRRRAQIAEHMTYSLGTAAHVAAVAEIDVSRLIAARNADAPAAEARGLKLTFMPYIVAHLARALAEHPELNATVQGQALVLRGERNIGVAVDTEEGLVVPVIRRADELGLAGIARALTALAERARTGKLTAEDVSGGSFTVSNPGRDGNLFGISIIRQPEVAILRLGSIVKRAVVREVEGEDVIVVRPMMYAALSYDHRVIDGRTGNAFLNRVGALIAATTPQLAR